MFRRQAGTARTVAICLLIVVAAALLLAKRDLRAFPGSIPASVEAQKCAKALDKAGAGLFKARLKECSRCERNQTADKESEATDCSAADPLGKIAKARGKAAAGVASECTDPTVTELGLGVCGPTVAALQACVGDSETLSQELCLAMHGVTALSQTQKAEAKCQAALSKWASRMAQTVLKEEGKCLAATLKLGTLELPRFRRRVIAFSLGLPPGSARS